MSPIYVPGKVTLAKDYTEGDRYFSNVSLLMHGDGANGSTTIVDSSPTPKTVTAVGNAQISTAQSKFGGSSIAFDGDGDYLTVPASSAFDFDDDPVTIEAWIWLPTQTGDVRTIYSQRTDTSGISFRVENTGALRVFYANGLRNAVSTNLVPAQTWMHVAVTIDAGRFNLWLGGTFENQSPLLSHSFEKNLQLEIGSRSGGEFFNGYIDELRVTKGVARYTSNFTPPTAPFADAQY